MVAAAVERIGRLEPGGENHDVAGGFVDGHVGQFAPADVFAFVPTVVGHVGINLYSFADDDGLAPCFAAVLASLDVDATGLPVLLEDEHGAVLGHGDVSHHRHFLGPGFVERFLFGDLVWEIDCRRRKPSGSRCQRYHASQTKRAEFVLVSHCGNSWDDAVMGQAFSGLAKRGAIAGVMGFAKAKRGE